MFRIEERISRKEIREIEIQQNFFLKICRGKYSGKKRQEKKKKKKKKINQLYLEN